MKYIFNFLILFCVQISFAQLTLTNLDDGTPINDGDSFDFETIDLEEAKLRFVISNSSETETIFVLAEMVSFTNTNGNNVEFCVNPECYFNVSPGSTIPGDPIELGPGEDNLNFDSFSNTNPGDGENYPMTFTIRFFMLDEDNNEVGEDITIFYNYTPENFSTSDFTLNDLGVELYNTVVSESLNFKTNTKVNLNVYDLNGRQLESYNANAGRHQFNLSYLSTGHYIVVFENNNSRKVQVKIQKK